ncbi:MAG: peptidase [Candidatus Altiarchaeales archaeon]|nr:MAG: peptidase [Candidatus Altiarchaeales archaeon]
MYLQMRMYLLIGLLFAILYALFVIVGQYLGVGSFIAYGILAFIMLFIQYIASPYMIEFAMGIRYVSEEEEPELHQMVSELARNAGIKKPRIGISRLGIPNAFAFGRSISDGRICITEGIREILSREELKAVLGHEISHIKNRDVMVMTMLSVIPMICWYLAWNFLFFGDNRRGNTAIIGLFAFLLYFLTNMLVLYGSRIREYYADKGSVALGNPPHYLASALYKIVYGSAKMPRSLVRQAEGFKAFFLNDPSKAYKEIQEIGELDIDMSGTIDEKELAQLKRRKIKLSTADKIMELLSTHPNMLKRIRYLSTLQTTPTRSGITRTQ